MAMRPAAHMPRRRALGLACLGAGAALLGGCTALPRSGAVQQSTIAPTDSDALIETAPGPTPNASPEQIVYGFLRAVSAGFSDDFATARQFLTGQAVEQWQPMAAVQVYSGTSEPQVVKSADGSVTVSAGSIGRRDADGVFILSTKDAVHETSFTLATTADSQWRIVGLDAGILLPLTQLTQHFASYRLAFLSRDHERCIPEIRWYPRKSPARDLLAGLIGGPSEWLAPGVTTALSSFSSLEGEGVTIDTASAVATVRLSADADPGSAKRGLLVAQIKETLIQLNEVEDVRVLAGAQDLGRPADLAPLVPEIGRPVGMAQGNVVRGTGTTRDTLATAQALGTAQCRHPALGADGSVYTLSASSLLHLAPGGTAASAILSVGEPTADAGGLGAPIVDRHGWAWLMAEGWLTAVDAAGQKVYPTASWLSGQGIEAFDLSVESERIVVRMDGGSVSLAVILRDDDGRPTGLGVAREMRHAGGPGTSGIFWCSPSSVGTLAAPEEDGGIPSVRIVTVGGIEPKKSVGVPGAQTVIANRSDGTFLLHDSSGQILHSPGATWRVLTTEVTDLSFPLP
ncbi:GerMN domain-containing protein [Actinomyces slackii]|uniref:Lipoprotein LpqB n=1 Tax=Actinomyces slackii TaxID=52774 RepID=A0A448KFV8_9ACTO|nr:GerMN domain-containing protein [Actinomyces slackii]VEG75834.1 lipoprotein LpqB [Actinomyces slackii]